MKKIKIKRELFKNFIDDNFIEIFQLESKSKIDIKTENLNIFLKNINEFSKKIQKINFERYLSAIQIRLIAFLNCLNNIPICQKCLKYRINKTNYFIMNGSKKFTKNIENKCNCTENEILLSSDTFNINLNFFIVNNFEKTKIWLDKFNEILFFEFSGGNKTKFIYETNLLFIDIFNSIDTLKFHLFCVSENIYLGHSWNEYFLNSARKEKIKIIQGYIKGKNSKEEFINLLSCIKNKVYQKSSNNELENIINKINPININSYPETVKWIIIIERNNLVHNSLPISKAFPPIFELIEDKFSEVFNILKESEKNPLLWKIKLILLIFLDYIYTFYIVLEFFDFLE